MGKRKLIRLVVALLFVAGVLSGSAVVVYRSTGLFCHPIVGPLNSETAQATARAFATAARQHRQGCLKQLSVKGATEPTDIVKGLVSFRKGMQYAIVRTYPSNGNGNEWTVLWFVGGDSYEFTIISSGNKLLVKALGGVVTHGIR